jgi:hypothetical protein
MLSYIHLINGPLSIPWAYVEIMTPTQYVSFSWPVQEPRFRNPSCGYYHRVEILQLTTAGPSLFYIRIQINTQ